MRTNSSDPSMCGTTMERHMLPYNIVVPNFQPRLFVIVFQMLGGFTKYTSGVDVVFRTNGDRTLDMDIRANRAPWSDMDFVFDYAVGTDLYTIRDVCQGRDNSCMVN